MRAQDPHAGFSILELMAVLAIIGILLAIAVPLFNAASENARARACLSNLRTLDSSVEQWKARTDLDPATRWGGPCVDQDPYACGNLVDDISPSISNWDSAIYCTSIHLRHHVTIDEISEGRSTARFMCTGGPDGVPHDN